MKIEFVTKNYTAGEKIKNIITKKVDRLDKFFDGDIKIKIMLKVVGKAEILELTIMLDGIVLRAEVSSDNMYDNIDIALPKLEKQIVKHRKKLTEKSKKISIKELEQGYLPTPEPEESHKLVRTKVYALAPMTIENAIEELELVGHSFYVFLNKFSMRVNVLYRRNDGDYGLIETVE